jgi:hypothetical protein
MAPEIENVVEEVEPVEVIEETEAIDDNAPEGAEIDGANPAEGGEAEAPEVEDWMKTEDDEEDSPKPQKFLKAKKRLKGELAKVEGERDSYKDEIEKLKAQIAAKETQKPSELKRPRELDYETDEEYNAALEKYDSDLVESKLQSLTSKSQQEEAVRKAREAVSKAVDDHYERASQLVESSGIKPEVYQASDSTLRSAVESIMPGRGEMVVDHLISTIGEGSEKVAYFLGRNKTALSEFQSLLLKDPNGIQAAIYLGQQKERLTNPRKPKSQAPAPAAKVGGDQAKDMATSLKRKYDDAHKKGDASAAFDIKREARKTHKIDTSKW